MLYFKKIYPYLKNTILWFVIMIFILTILSYFNLISENIIKIVKLIIPIIIIAINSFKSSKKLNMKGYLSGFLYSGIIIVSLFIINTIFFRIYNFKLFIYFIIIILTGVLSAMIGRTKKIQ